MIYASITPPYNSDTVFAMMSIRPPVPRKPSNKYIPNTLSPVKESNFFVFADSFSFFTSNFMSKNNSNVGTITKTPNGPSVCMPDFTY